MALDTKRLEKAGGKVERLRSVLSCLSNSAWLAIGTFFILISITAAAWLLAWNNPLWVPWEVYQTPTRAAVLLGLAIVACTSEYFLFRIWFNESPLPDKDLQGGWAAGQDSFRSEKVNLTARPCFLLIDPSGLAEQWFAAAAIRVRSHGAAVASPVKWFQSEDALFLAVEGLGSLGPLTRDLSTLQRSSKIYATANETTRQHMSLRAEAASTSMHALEDEHALKTSIARSSAAAVPNVAVGQHDADDQQEASAAGDDSAFLAIDVADVRGALLVPEDASSDLEQDSWTEQGTSMSTQRSVEKSDNGSSNDSSHVRVSSIETARESRRLAEVCRRLASCRRPVVPVNGICVLLPETLLAGVRGSGMRLGHAMRHDLQLLQEELDVTAPVSILLAGADEDQGFSELIRRGGPEAAAIGSLGVSTPPVRATSEAVGKFCDEFTGRVYQHVGRRFRNPRSLGKPGASRLFQLMASVRGDRGTEWRGLIAKAFLRAESEPTDLFAGVSIAGTGDLPTKRAFARSMYEQLIENQEFVEWTPKAQRRERLLSIFACLFGVIALAMIVWLTGIMTGLV